MIAGGGEQMTLRAVAQLADACHVGGTVSQVTDLIGQYRDAGVQLLINSDYRNDMETLELFALEIMPHFA